MTDLGFDEVETVLCARVRAQLLDKGRAARRSWTGEQGDSSRRRDFCHSAAPRSPFSGCFSRVERGRQQNDGTLADG